MVRIGLGSCCGSRRRVRQDGQLARGRGLADALIVCCDGLRGLPESIRAAWPEVTVQTCVVPMAARHQRKHQRSAAPVLAQRNRPLTDLPTGPRSDRRRTQRPTSTRSRMGDTIRSIRPNKCNDRMRAPLSSVCKNATLMPVGVTASCLACGCSRRLPAWDGGWRVRRWHWRSARCASWHANLPTAGSNSASSSAKATILGARHC